MSNDVEEIKNRLDITDIVGAYVNLKKAGSNLKGVCPFHSEKTPSFMVNPERQIFKCFGCNEGGDMFAFLMKIENLTFPEALKMLADKAGYTLQDRATSGKSSTEPDVKSRLYQINHQTAQVFHALLTKHKAGKSALDYIKNRGVTDTTLADFCVGFAPNEPVLADFLQKRGFTSAELKKAGSPERFKNRLIFPISDVLGNIVGFTGRALDPDTQSKYYNTPETPIFYKSRTLYGLEKAKNTIKQKDYAVLLEGQMDVILAHQVGITNAIASSGTALTQDHLRVIRRLTDKLCFSFDMDEAGQQATLKGLSLAQELGFTVKVVMLPKPYKDAGEAIQADQTIFKTALKEAVYAMDWVMARAFIQSGVTEVSYQTLSVTQKKAVAKTVIPFLAGITDPIEQGHWIARLAKRLGVREENITTALEKNAKKPPVAPKQPTEQPATPTKQLTPDELLYGLLYLTPELQQQYSELYKQLDSTYHDNRFNIEFLAAEHKKALGDTPIGDEIARLVGRRSELAREQLKHSFASEIAKAEQAGDRAAVKTLLEKLQKEISA